MIDRQALADFVVKRNKILHDMNAVVFDSMLRQSGAYEKSGPPLPDTLLGGMHKARIAIGKPEFSDEEIQQSKDWLDHKGWSYLP